MTIKLVNYSTDKSISYKLTSIIFCILCSMQLHTDSMTLWSIINQPSLKKIKNLYIYFAPARVAGTFCQINTLLIAVTGVFCYMWVSAKRMKDTEG